MGKVFKKLRCRYQKFVRGARIKGKINGAAGKIFCDRLFGTRKAKFR